MENNNEITAACKRGDSSVVQLKDQAGGNGYFPFRNDLLNTLKILGVLKPLFTHGICRIMACCLYI